MIRGGRRFLPLIQTALRSQGAVLMCLLSRRTDNNMEELSDTGVGVCSSLKSLFKSHANWFSDVRMLLIIPLIAYSGLQVYNKHLCGQFQYLIPPLSGFLLLPLSP
ncbi:hypothetical protein K1719_032206 [Acacia pycnantha]|nr:hypothetical protein K1719_032206 [Acacia pycnantha]